MLSLGEVQAAAERLAAYLHPTATVHSRLFSTRAAGDVYLKLENLQPINAFKLRGAANAVALLGAEARSKGVWTISAGNAGQGVAYAARQAGVPCAVLVIDKAPENKIERMRNLGATLVKAPFVSESRSLGS